VLFQLSFAIFGPAIWWVTSRLPHHYGVLVVGAAMSLVPGLASLHAILRAQWERDAPVKKAESEEARNAWFPALDLGSMDPQEILSEELQARMRMWLSYWALWPFFHVAYTVANSLDRIGKEDRPTIDGLFVALIVWSQFWEASRVAPYGFALGAAFLQGFTQKAGRVADVAGTHAAGQAATFFARYGEQLSTSSPVLYVAIGLVVVILVSVVLKIVELTEALVTIVFLICVAFDSARCVARSMADVYISRLAFWVIAMAWLQFRTLPFLGPAVIVWTPLVLVAALAAGETILNSIIYFAGSMRTKLCTSAEEDQSLEEARNTKYQEVSSRENVEDGRMLSRTPLSQSSAA
jgi:hypothetical protein